VIKKKLLQVSHPEFLVIFVSGTRQFTQKRKRDETTDQQPRPDLKKPKYEKPDLSYAEMVQSFTPEKMEIEPTKPGQHSKELFANATFEDLELQPRLYENLTGKMNLSTPTRIQQKAIPPLLQGKDVLIKAETGSGKTLAYLIPVVQQLLKIEDRLDRKDGTYAIVISPTRELCLQIYEVLEKLVRPFAWLVPGHVIGGEKKKSEKARLRKGITILVATPGRLLDHLNNSYAFTTSKLRFLVFDEADRLLDMGFETEIRNILRLLGERSNGVVTPKRQTVLASATLTKEVDALALLSLQDSVKVGLTDEEEEDQDYQQHKLPSGLTQYYTISRPKKRLIHLAVFLHSRTNGRANEYDDGSCKVIVFASNCDSVEFLHTLLSAIKLPSKAPQPNKKKTDGTELIPLIGVPFFKLHGNLDQATRTATWMGFRDSPSAIMLCTDVAARGLDLPLVNWIVQYDVPSDPRAYVHRIGRTARIGTTGNALLFVMPSEEEYIQILMKKQMTFTQMSTEELFAGFYSNLAHNSRASAEVEENAVGHCIKTITGKKDDDGLDWEALGIKAYQSFLRSYATHVKSTKHIFHLKNLHLGHIAKSFGLSAEPATLSTIMHKKQARQEQEKKAKQGKLYLKNKTNHNAEFASGM